MCVNTAVNGPPKFKKTHELSPQQVIGSIGEVVSAQVKSMPAVIALTPASPGGTIVCPLLLSPQHTTGDCGSMLSAQEWCLPAVTPAAAVRPAGTSISSQLWWRSEWACTTGGGQHGIALVFS